MHHQKEGLIPVESFEKGDRIHFGNKIVSMGALEAKPAGGVPTRGKTLAESVSFESKEPRPKAEPKTEGAFRTAVIDELYPLQRYVSEAGIENRNYRRSLSHGKTIQRLVRKSRDFLGLQNF